MNRYKLLEQKCRDLLDEVGFGTSRKSSGGFQSWVSVGKKIFKEEKMRETFEDIYNIIYRPATVQTPDLIYHNGHPHTRIPDSWDLMDGDIYLNESGDTGETLRTGGTGEDAKVASSAVAFYRPLREFTKLADEKLIVEDFQSEKHSPFEELDYRKEKNVDGYYYFRNEHFVKPEKELEEAVVFDKAVENWNDALALNERDEIRIAVVDSEEDVEKDWSRLTQEKDKKKREQSLEEAASEVYERATEYIKMGEVQAVSVEEDEIVITFHPDEDRVANVSVPY